MELQGKKERKKGTEEINRRKKMTRWTSHFTFQLNVLALDHNLGHGRISCCTQPMRAPLIWQAGQKMYVRPLSEPKRVSDHWHFKKTRGLFIIIRPFRSSSSWGSGVFCFIPHQVRTKQAKKREYILPSRMRADKQISLPSSSWSVVGLAAWI